MRRPRPAGWPAYMTGKRLKSGALAYYWQPPSWARERGCPVEATALGEDFLRAVETATGLNADFKSWRTGEDALDFREPVPGQATMGWLSERFMLMGEFRDLPENTQRNYEYAISRVLGLPAKRNGQPCTIKALSLAGFTPEKADRAYRKILTEPKRPGQVTAGRAAGFAMDVWKRAWKSVRRYHPDHVPEENPFDGVHRKRHTPQRRIGATREQAFTLAKTLRDMGHPALGVACLVAFEWLQRPDNIFQHLHWSDFRAAEWPNEVRIIHGKTGEERFIPLESPVDGSRYFPELEDMIQALPRLGDRIVMFRDKRTRKIKPYRLNTASHLVMKARDRAGLPAHVNLASLRPGGITLNAAAGASYAEATALSAHRTADAHDRYVNRTREQMIHGLTKRQNYLAKGTE